METLERRGNQNRLDRGGTHSDSCTHRWDGTLFKALHPTVLPTCTAEILGAPTPQVHCSGSGRIGRSAHLPSIAQLFAGPTFQNCWSFGHHSSTLNHRALPLGRLIKRTPTHTPVPPNPAVEPLAVSFINSFFCYALKETGLKRDRT